MYVEVIQPAKFLSITDSCICIPIRFNIAYADKRMRAANYTVLGVLISACSFTATVDNSATDAVNAVDSNTADAVASSCNPACGPNSACNMANLTCTCNAGFTPGSNGCDDTNECAVDDACGAQQCVNSVGSFRCYTPATCKEVQVATAAAVDQEYTLYVGGDETKPWSSFCKGMSTETPTEYLTLPTPSENTGQYKDGGASSGNTVTTTYQKVRIDPVTLALNASDQSFATSTGSLTHSNSNVTVTAMPLGVAMSCVARNDSSGRARINLIGTNFHVTAQFAAGGSQAGIISDNVVVSNVQQKVVLKGGGFCGWFAAAGFPGNPFNQNGSTIQLSYQ
jgi:hypothetical protein